MIDKLPEFGIYREAATDDYYYYQHRTKMWHRLSDIGISLEDQATLERATVENDPERFEPVPYSSGLKSLSGPSFAELFEDRTGLSTKHSGWFIPLIILVAAILLYFLNSPG